MKKESNFIFIIASVIICAVILLIIWALPFLYMYIGLFDEGKTGAHNLKWDKLAVKYSIFKNQKIHTIPAAVTLFSLARDYDTVIEYSKELERIGELTNADKFFISNAYMKKGDYPNSLKYATNKYQKLSNYIYMGEIEKAQIIVDQLLTENPVKPTTYLYKSEIEIETNNWHDAEIWIDKLLKINPQHLEALKVKAKILKHFVRTDEYKIYEQKIQNRENEIKIKIIK